jgi:hypothetical protein
MKTGFFRGFHVQFEGPSDIPKLTLPAAGAKYYFAFPL